MSTAPSVDPARARPVGLLAAGTGLALAAVSVGVLVWARPRAVDGPELLASTFEVGPLPFDLRVVSAARLPTGERTVLLEPAVTEAEAPPAKPPEESGAKRPEGEGQPDPGRKRFDWSKVPLGEAGRPPRQVWILWFPDSAAEAALKRQFQEVEWKEARHLGEQGGLAAVDGGKLAWSGYDADFVHLRLCENGGTFRDTIRVNLSAAGRRCALHAVWSRGLPGSKERVKEILEALAPSASTDPKAG